MESTCVLRENCPLTHSSCSEFLREGWWFEGRPGVNWPDALAGEQRSSVIAKEQSTMSSFNISATSVFLLLAGKSVLKWFKQIIYTESFKEPCINVLLAVLYDTSRVKGWGKRETCFIFSQAVYPAQEFHSSQTSSPGSNCFSGPA